MKPVVAITNCKVRGVGNSRNGEHEVRIQMPSSKKVSRSGCPACNRERAKEALQNSK